MVLEAAKGRSTRKCNGQYGAEGDQGLEEASLHWSFLLYSLLYQVLALASGVMIEPPRGSRVPQKRKNRPDGVRSVALPAPPLPKCPFREKYQRVQTC